MAEVVRLREEVCYLVITLCQCARSYGHARRSSSRRSKPSPNLYPNPKLTPSPNPYPTPHQVQVARWPLDHFAWQLTGRRTVAGRRGGGR